MYSVHVLAIVNIECPSPSDKILAGSVQNYHTSNYSKAKGKEVSMFKVYALLLRFRRDPV